QTSEELQKYYNMNIICPHYRYMEAVGFFYGYFCSGRCQTIAEAYKIFEEELKQGWAVDNFSDFEEIRCNRKCALYEDISECDKMVESITEHIESEINKINQA
ncbi:MAG: hypothetical protein ACI4RP_04660, partial [Acutalibacteraceae bacterium]